MMFDSGIPGFGISIAFVMWHGRDHSGVLLLWLATYLLKARRRGRR